MPDTSVLGQVLVSWPHNAASEFHTVGFILVNSQGQEGQSKDDPNMPTAWVRPELVLHGNS